LQLDENIGHFLRPARSCPWPPRLARPPSATPQANAGLAWQAGELAMAGGLEHLPQIWNDGIAECWKVGF